MALACRKAATTLRAGVPKDTRAKILKLLAAKLVDSEAAILAANEADLTEALSKKVDENLVSRLKLTPAKLAVLAQGITQLAEQTDPLGQLLRRTEVSEGLLLEQIRVPLGVLLVIFESRPDALPQIAALSIFSGNGLILKGGKEAARSNAALHALVAEAIVEATAGAVPASLVSLVTSRDEIASLLELDDCIDLVIPRGSGELVKSIQRATRIPVMGHSEGICHVYLDAAAAADKAVKIAVDSKINYPAACNACETLLIHDSLLASGLALQTLTALRAAGVTLWAGPRLMAAAATAPELAATLAGPAPTLKHEYGDKQLSVEAVSSLDAAVTHISANGSRHTESIVTEDAAAAEAFLATVDAACVFHNASTRFADGFRFGLGAEVGISTSPIHARGPVGVEGLTSTKWRLVSGAGHTVGAFAAGEFQYTHKSLPLN
jgi:delta-1-pyrroline-5-carboxylate synthetase